MNPLSNQDCMLEIHLNAIKNGNLEQLNHTVAKNVSAISH